MDKKITFKQLSFWCKLGIIGGLITFFIYTSSLILGILLGLFNLT
jgi:hypothetical protein